MYEDSNSQGGRGLNPPQYNINVGRGQYANKNYYSRAVSPRGFGLGFDNNYLMKKTRLESSYLFKKCKFTKGDTHQSYPIPYEYGTQINYMREENMYKQIYQDSYNMCVTKLKYDNKNIVLVDGYEVCAMIDTGSTICVNSSDLFQKMKQTTKVDIKKCDRQCMIANGSNINLDTIVYVSVK